jgi:hypothetical protein
MPQNSKLAVFAEKFIQAGWLLALIAAPLYFNIYSSRVFEPDKISLIRTLALAMGAAWLILRAERRRSQPGTRNPAENVSARLRAWALETTRANPLAIPALLILLAYLVSTLLSVSPTVSFFGSYQRLQGLYTYSSYLVIFFLAASLLQTRAEIERAISIALVASFPVALYGIIQHFFLDPLPWVGDVTTRVASTLGNSIFIGAFLILVIPLALARLLQTTARVRATMPGRPPVLIYLAALVTFLGIAAAWGLSFDVGVKSFIEANYSGVLNPEQLAATSGAFALALGVSFLAVALWWGAAIVLKQRAANFLLIALYAALLAVQCVALFFSQSRGPLLGMLGGLFAFGVLYALARGARKLAVGAVSLALLGLLFLVLLNLSNSPLAGLREVPYIGRLGRIFETEGGTGRVRVLIWQGALQLTLPHEPLWAPTTGTDAFNPIRPFVGYGPETMYVAYNRFYPPELGTLESRNATPDRSHNETFDALVTTGLFGFIAENILFLVIFYLALKWLGLIHSPRARNIFIALWFGGGALLAILFGVTLGWEFIGVALPGGMMLGLFTYLVAFAVRARKPTLAYSDTALWLAALTSLFVAHFIEIHFGIAIVTTRVYFWFFAAVFVALGVRAISMSDVENQNAAENLAAPSPPPTAKNTPTVRPKNVPGAPVKKTTPRAAPANVRRVSSAPMITFAFLVGFVLAVMGFDYINTNNASAVSSQVVSGLDLVISALTFKTTTAGPNSSWAMLWLLLTTLGMGMGIGMAEWGRVFRLGARDWGIAALLFVVLAFAIFSGLAFYHVMLIATTGTGILDALLASVVLFSIFMLLIAIVCALSLMFDEPLPTVLVRHTANWVVLPVLVLVTGILITATNIDPVRADMLYKQAAGLPGENADTAVQLYQRALALQPQQDYYLLFLGRAYLDAAKNETDANARAKLLDNAEDALHAARALNPFNTDHSANLARLSQARGTMAPDFEARRAAYAKASEYFEQATRLSPQTVHLFDQHAQALIEYQMLLQDHGDVSGAEQARAQALAQLHRAEQIDPTFCLTYAVRAQAQTDWRLNVKDALEAVRRAPACGDVFINEGLSVAVAALARAGEAASQANAGSEFEQWLNDAVKTTPSLEVYTTLANYYSKAGRIPEAIVAIDGALANMPHSDEATRKRYEDFRFTLVQLQKALEAAQAAPNDPEAQRAVANQWLARAQFDFALPAFERVATLKPDDYAARRNVALLLIATDQFARAGEAIQAITPTAPAEDRNLWNKLNAAVTAIQQNDTAQAITLVEELAKNADKNDFALVSALRALAVKLQGAG